jgi:hypothetical protein
MGVRAESDRVVGTSDTSTSFLSGLCFSTQGRVTQKQENQLLERILSQQRSLLFLVYRENPRKHTRYYKRRPMLR